MPLSWHLSGSLSDLLAKMRLFISLPAIWLTLMTIDVRYHDNLAMHPLHLSKSVVEYFPEEKMVRVSLHVFLDDLEEALQKNHTVPILLGSSRESAEAGTLLEAYFKKHFRFTVDGNSAPLQLLGKELSADQEALWCYLEVPVSRRPEKIKVNCTLLTDLFRDQQNILHFIFPGEAQKTALLGRNRTEAIFVVQK